MIPSKHLLVIGDQLSTTEVLLRTEFKLAWVASSNKEDAVTLVNKSGIRTTTTMVTRSKSESGDQFVCISYLNDFK